MDRIQTLATAELPTTLIAGENVTATTASNVTRIGRYVGFQPKANTAITGATEYEGLVRWGGDNFDSITPLHRLTPAAPTVDVVALLTAVAGALVTEPHRILTTTRLIRLVLTLAGPTVTEGQLRPVWEVLPHHPNGDEHAEYAALLLMIARDL